jgi:tungstate transport system substrate-binding protein
MGSTPQAPWAPNTISDRGTWVALRNKGDLVVAVEGDRRLLSQCGVMIVNPAKHPKVKAPRQQFMTG